MSKKDRNKSTVVILRDFNCELLENLKDFTNEKTNSKAIKLVCARYLNFEKVTNNQCERIEEFELSENRIKNIFRQVESFKKQIAQYMQG